MSIKVYDALVVGAGPIGLMTAVKMKTDNPSVNIVVIEKRDEYTRGHTVKVEKTALRSLKNQHREFENILDEIVGHTPIKKIEERLYTLAKKVGITVHRGSEYKVDEEHKLSAFVTRYRPKVVIAADGRKSTCLEEIDGNIEVNRRVYENFQTLLKVDFLVTAQWKTAYSRRYEQFFSKFDASSTTNLEGRIERKIWGPNFSKTPDENGKYKVTAFIQLSKEENKAIMVEKPNAERIPLGDFKNKISIEKTSRMGTRSW